MSEATRKRTLVLKPFRRSSVLGSTSRLLNLGGGGSKILDKNTVQTRQAVRVHDEEGNDVTPQPLYQVDPGTASRFLVDEAFAGSASDHTTVTGSFTLGCSRSVFGSSRRSSQSTIESVYEEREDIFFKRDPFVVPDEKVIKHTVVEEMTEDVLNEVVRIFLTESDTVSLLDIPSLITSVDADDAESIIETKNQYDVVDRSRKKSVDQSTQTPKRTTKNKLVQSVGPIWVDAATAVSTLDMSDDPEQEQNVDSSEAKRTDSAEAGLELGTEMSGSLISSTSTVSASTSLKEVGMFGNILNTQSDVQLIMMSEKFQSSLFAMERTVLSNCFHLEQAAYRQVPPLQDPDRPLSKSAAESSPSLRRLWAFSCELSRGRSVNSMAWNKKNPDLLAVGYGELNSKKQQSGLVCCWSYKNPMWPDRIIHLKSSVTSLDFSVCNPVQLAVGMCDGTIAIYNVQSPDLKSHIFSSRHMSPVWQLKWIQQELGVTGEKVEALFSVGDDGRIKKWSVFKGVLDCTDLMRLKKMKDGTNKTEKMTESLLTALIPGLCFDFHPTNASIYLVGTGDGLIHKCSCFNKQQILETYRKHTGPVNSISWCPLKPDIFLTCSSDWTIQLWKQDHLNPVLGFTSTHGGVRDIKWSPTLATVFGTVTDEQFEIWNLDSSFLDPVIVQPAAPDVTMTSLLFASHSDCVVVGDIDGQVTVYLLNNLSVGLNSQGNILDEFLCAAASRELQKNL